MTAIEVYRKDYLSFSRPSGDPLEDYLKGYLSFHRPPDDTPGGLPQRLPLLPQTTWWHPWRTISRTTSPSPDHLMTPLEDYLKDYLSSPRPPDDTPGGLPQGLPEGADRTPAEARRSHPRASHGGQTCPGAGLDFPGLPLRGHNWWVFFLLFSSGLVPIKNLRKLIWWIIWDPNNFLLFDKV